MSERSPRVRRMRTDAGRKQRIAEAALVVIGQKGIAGLTHRAIAAAADIPLGSTTYHFASLDDIVEAAFEQAMHNDAERLAEWARSLPSTPDIPSEVAALVRHQVAHETDIIVVNYELTLAAAHRPRLHAMAVRWSKVLTDLLVPFVGGDAAEAVSATYDGLLLRQLVSSTVPPTYSVEGLFRRACGNDPRTGD